MNRKENYLSVFSNCFLTKGVSRSLIFDYQREDLFFISNLHYDFLSQCKSSPFKEVEIEFNDLIEESELQEFISFGLENELFFWTNTPDFFPDVEVHFEHPSLITNAIIDIDKTSKHNYTQIFEQLESVGCKDVQVRFYSEETYENIVTIIELSRLNMHGQSIELILKNTIELTDERLFDLTQKFIFIKSIVVHSAEKNELFKINSHAMRSGMGNILFTKQRIDSSSHCGIIHSAGFNYNNISAYMEAKNFNSCLNKKIGIDVDGSVKNCPSQEKSYGSVVTDSILEICLSNKFQEVWSINKDQVKICSDCEFKYICSDCRIFIEDKSDIYSKPLKCNYDPYTATWAEV